MSRRLCCLDFLGGQQDEQKWLSSILVAIFSIAALVFIIIGKFNFAVLAMTIMFALSNGFRAKSFKEQGYVKEAKWMQYMAIFSQLHL